MRDPETSRLVAEIEALPEYRGWSFAYEYPGYFCYHQGRYSVFFTPDWERPETLDIQVQVDDGRDLPDYGDIVPLPREGRTGQLLFQIVRPTLDKLLGQILAEKVASSLSDDQAAAVMSRLDARQEAVLKDVIAVSTKCSPPRKESPVTESEFMKKLLHPMRARGHGPEFPWRFIGPSAYLRTSHGVFKLESWSGGTHGQIAGVYGTFTSHAGAQDQLVFEFRELLAPDRRALKNPSLADTHPIHAWHPGNWAAGVEWYVAPVSTQPLHEAIGAWVDAWGGA